MSNFFKLLFITITIFSTPSYASTETGKFIGGKISDIPDWFKESFLELDEDVEVASDEGKHVLLYMHLSGCPYCYKMIDEGFKTDPNLSNIKQNFDVIAINIRGDKDVTLPGGLEISEREIGDHLKVLFTPTLVFLNEKAKPVYKMSGYRSPKNLAHVLDYVKSKSYLNSTLSKFVDNQARNEIYVFRSHPNFIPETDLTRFSDKPLMVIFEDKYCDLCNKYHDGLFADKDVRQLMDNFAVVRLDANSSSRITLPSGKVSTPSDWIQSVGLDYRPGILLFDQGKEISRITGLLYKYHFSELLRYVGTGLHFEFPDSFYDYLSIRSREIMDNGGTIDLSDTMNSIVDAQPE